MKHYSLRNSFLLLLLFIARTDLWAQIPFGYYNNATGKQGEELKNALHDIVKGHHVVSYGGLINAFAYTDCKPNGKIWDIYSNIEYSTSTGLCGEYEQEGDCWNREHTWPQSWFNESTTPRSDLFHVYPTDGYVNGRRSNYPYGEVNRPTYSSGNGSKLGPCATSGYSGTVFEPIDEYKGDIARGYFYMSVRYCGEDDDWGTSGMTNKSEIKPWALAMLLRWSDEDPVSQKEIDRNNAVYGYQNNRNPFIDHPEYAHMIWDENWQGGISYNITCITGLSHGSVSTPESAMEGSTVIITATPDAGYMVGSYMVYKTGSPSTVVSVSSNGTFIMPAFAVTVSATFIVNNTYYSIALGSVSHGSINANPQSAKSGTTINLTATPANGYSLYSWYVFKEGDMNTTVAVSDNKFTMPAFNVMVMATFVQGNANGNYVKVTSAPTDWSGEYILVYEHNNTTGYVWTGQDEANCYVSKTIANNTIANADFITIIMTSMTGGYSIKVNGGPNDGKYIYGTSGNNRLNFGSNPALNTLSFESNSVKITSNTSVMRYNNTSSQNRFRYFKSDTYTQQQPIQLYKKTVASQTHTIHFDGNGGVGTMNDQIVNEFEATALVANTFIWANHQFDGWNTEADGSGIYYADEAMVRLLDDITLYAQWESLYSITISNTIQNGTVNANVTQAIEEQTITLTAVPDAGYELDHWIVTDANNRTITVRENQFEMPACHVTVSAVFSFVGVFEQKYFLVTDISQLVVGRAYLIVNTTAGKALGKIQNTNNRSAETVSIENNVIASVGSSVCELILGNDGGYWTFFDANWNNSGGYLYAASSSANQLKTQATNDANGKWSVSFSDGVATIRSQGSNTRNIIKYNPNNGTPIFSCYASGQQDVKLFIRSEQYEHQEDVVLSCLNTFDKHTVRSGVAITANRVLGTTLFNDPSHLVIEDGAQFIHNAEGVKATLRKNIAGYVSGAGWYTIASPMTIVMPDESNLTDGDYDLYAYHENDDLEWNNYKLNGFDMDVGSGYLYAHSSDFVLRMSGVLNNGDLSETITLRYESSNESLRGFNLLGNPTAHNITFSKTDGVSDGYYYLNDDETWTYTTSNMVPVGRGFMVKANANGQTVTLNSQRVGKSDVQCHYLCLSLGDEKVYVDLDEGVSMPMMVLDGRHASLYFTQGQKSYAMVVRGESEILELNYEVRNNGFLTLSVDAQDLDLEYLHLIDIVTGDDVDLLDTPYYSFETKTTDPISRFRLVFDANVSDVLLGK